MHRAVTVKETVFDSQEFTTKRYGYQKSKLVIISQYVKAVNMRIITMYL